MEFIRRGLAEVRLISKLNIFLPTFSEQEDDDIGMQKDWDTMKKVWRFCYLPSNQSLDAWQEKRDASEPTLIHSESFQKSRAALKSPLSHRIQPPPCSLTEMQITVKKRSSQGSTKLDKGWLSTTGLARTNSKPSSPLIYCYISISPSDKLGWIWGLSSESSPPGSFSSPDST